MIQWQQARPSERFLAVLGFAGGAIGIAMAALVVVTLINAAFVIMFREHARGMAFPGPVSWAIAYLVLSKRQASKRHFGDRDGARDIVVAMIVLAPLALLSAILLQGPSFFASMYLASFLYPGVWLNVPLR